MNGAKCPNCERWSSEWVPGDMCPECANGYDRAVRKPAKVLEPLTATVQKRCLTAEQMKKLTAAGKRQARTVWGAGRDEATATLATLEKTLPGVDCPFGRVINAAAVAELRRLLGR